MWYEIFFEKTYGEALYVRTYVEKFLGSYHSFAPHTFLRKHYYENRLRDVLASVNRKRVLVVRSVLGSEVIICAYGACDVVGLDIDVYLFDPPGIPIVWVDFVLF
ncbi:MAG: hypothetical protein ACD_48C00575G0002 [uncultured bacterium]|nr:MAG: hypothetical protein ACD_48C00575G0002 [uncultured bacterium]